MIVELPGLICDRRARDGTWCRLPYPGHPKGCPNYPKCVQSKPSVVDLDFSSRKWRAVVEEFDLGAHARKMREAHPGWSDRQCRCLLYWQGGVKKRLAQGACDYLKTRSCRHMRYSIVLECPEASGINIYETMAGVGVILTPTHCLIDDPMPVVRKVALIGFPVGSD